MINHNGTKKPRTLYFTDDEFGYLKLQANLYSDILKKKVSVSESNRILIFGKAAVTNGIKK
tara:strand:+ start:242 stop:424 length:183 start_codon:yes stop_codon:yes gene_type:complete